jgi:hypothetical protein
MAVLDFLTHLRPFNSPFLLLFFLSKPRQHRSRATSHQHQLVKLCPAYRVSSVALGVTPQDLGSFPFPLYSLVELKGEDISIPSSPCHLLRAVASNTKKSFKTGNRETNIRNQKAANLKITRAKKIRKSQDQDPRRNKHTYSSCPLFCRKFINDCIKQ